MFRSFLFVFRFLETQTFFFLLCMIQCDRAYEYIYKTTKHDKQKRCFTVLVLFVGVFFSFFSLLSRFLCFLWWWRWWCGELLLWRLCTWSSVVLDVSMLLVRDRTTDDTLFALTLLSMANSVDIWRPFLVEQNVFAVKKCERELWASNWALARAPYTDSGVKKPLISDILILFH